MFVKPLNLHYVLHKFLLTGIGSCQVQSLAGSFPVSCTNSFNITDDVCAHNGLDDFNRSYLVYRAVLPLK